MNGIRCVATGSLDRRSEVYMANALTVYMIMGITISYDFRTSVALSNEMCLPITITIVSLALLS